MTTTPEPDPDAVRLVEDVIDATSVYVQTGNRADRVAIPTADTGPAIVRALVEAGRQPTAPVTHDSTHAGTEYVIEQRHEHRWVRARTIRVEHDDQHRQPWRLTPAIGRDERDARAMLDWYRTLHPHTTYRLVRDDITRTRTIVDP